MALGRRSRSRLAFSLRVCILGESNGINPMKLLAFLTGYSIIATVVASVSAAQFSEVQRIQSAFSDRDAAICEINSNYCK